MKQIKSKVEFEKLSQKVFQLMNKGEKNVTPEEKNTIREIGLAIQAYEEQLYPTQAPKTIFGMKDLMNYKKKLNQRK